MEPMPEPPVVASHAKAAICKEETMEQESPEERKGSEEQVGLDAQQMILMEGLWMTLMRDSWLRPTRSLSIMIPMRNQ